MKDLLTPALLLNKDKLVINCERMRNRVSDTIALRVHMKTAKSIDVYQLATNDGFKGITVSTLAEAAYFAGHGIDDILYAVGIVPGKLRHVQQLVAQGCDLKVITDTKSIISELNAVAKQLDFNVKLLIEIDCGGARGGVLADSCDLLEIAKLINSATNIEYYGLMTHAGHSYHSKSISEIIEIAEQERLAVIQAARRLKNELGLHSNILSTGSTPTATYAKSFEGLTEVRPGVYMFCDIDQYFIGSCGLEDIAISVLTTVIGHNKKANRILIDAGGLALSKDISASEFSSATGYGWITDHKGNHIQDAYVESVHQEHGLIKFTGIKDIPFDNFPVGSHLRILPIHACMTVAAFKQYQVHDNNNNLLDNWSRVNHW